MVTIYYARVLDTGRIERIVTAHKGTREWISKLPEGEPAEVGVGAVHRIVRGLQRRFVDLPPTIRENKYFR